MHDSVAVVESPLQLVALQEAVTIGAVRPPHQVIVRGATGAIGHTINLVDPGVRDAAVTLGTRATFERLRSAAELVVGDVFSTLAQLALSARRGHGRIVLLEDGAASVRAWRILATGGMSLARAHGRRRVELELGRLAASRLRNLAARSDVTIVAALPMSGAVAAELAAAGIHVVRHGFAWSRSVALPQDPVAEHLALTPRVVLGSALAADGHLDHGYYQRWLDGQFGEAPCLFLPHRRDDRGVIELARSRKVAVGWEHVLPVELVLRDVDVELVVESLPTTAVLTLPAVRGAHPTEVRVTCPPRSAWVPGTPAAMIDLVEEVATLADASDR